MCYHQRDGASKNKLATAKLIHKVHATFDAENGFRFQDGQRELNRLFFFFFYFFFFSCFSLFHKVSVEVRDWRRMKEARGSSRAQTGTFCLSEE